MPWYRVNDPLLLKASAVAGRRSAQAGSRKTYGKPAVHAELHARGVAVSRKHVTRLMRLKGLRARTRKRCRCTAGGKLCLAAILDLFSRMVVGWALSAANDRNLALRALEQALRRRCPEAGLLHHTDQGSPYASEDYQRVLAAHGITRSMSRCGNAHDNAAMESWFSTMTFEFGIASIRTRKRRQSCSTTSRCSTSRSAGTRCWGT